MSRVVPHLIFEQGDDSCVCRTHHVVWCLMVHIAAALRLSERSLTSWTQRIGGSGLERENTERSS